MSILPPDKVKDFLKTAKLLAKGEHSIDAIKLSAKEWQILKDFEKSADTVKTMDRGKDVGKVSGAKIPTLNSLSDEVASSLGGKASPLKNGYKVEIPNGKKPIVVRIMDEVSGGRGKPYYRVSIDGKGSLTPEGIISSDRGLTHIDLGENSMSEITNIIINYLGRK